MASRGSPWSAALAGAVACGALGCAPTLPDARAPREESRAVDATKPSDERPNERSAGPTSDRPEPSLELELTPPPERVSGWAGIGIWENLIQYGFSSDSRVLVLCMHDSASARFTKGCEFIDASSGRVLRHVTSREDYGAGEPHASDPAFAADFAKLGVPAPRGTTPLASRFVLRWEHRPKDQPFEHVTFVLEERRTGARVVLAEFDAHDPNVKPELRGLAVVPLDALLSPDGKKLALLVYRVGGPPLLAEARLVDLDLDAASTSN